MSYVFQLNLVNQLSLFPYPYFVKKDMAFDMDDSLVFTNLHLESKDSMWTIENLQSHRLTVQHLCLSLLGYQYFKAPVWKEFLWFLSLILQPKSLS